MATREATIIDIFTADDDVTDAERELAAAFLRGQHADVDGAPIRAEVIARLLAAPQADPERGPGPC